MNLVQLQENLKELPLQAVQAYMNGQNPEVPPYLAAAEMQRRTAMQQRAQQAEAPQQSVKDQLEQAAGLMALEQQRQQQAQQQMQMAQGQQPMPAGEGIPQPQMQPQPPAMMARGGVASLSLNDEMFNYAAGGVIGYQAGGRSALSINPAILSRQEEDERRREERRRFGQDRAARRAQELESFNERMRNDPRQIEMREEAERAVRELAAMSPSERASARGRRLGEFIRQVFSGTPSAVAQAPLAAPVRPVAGFAAGEMDIGTAPDAGGGRGIMAGPTAEQLAQAPRPAPNVMPTPEPEPTAEGGIQSLLGAQQAPGMPQAAPGIAPAAPGMPQAAPQRGSEARGILEGAMREQVPEPTVEESVGRTRELASGLGYEDVQRSRAGLEALMQQQYDPEKLRRERLMMSLGRGFSSGASADRALALQQQQEAGQRQSLQDILASQTGQAERQFTAGAQDFDRSRVQQGQREDRRLGAAGDIFRAEEARDIEALRERRAYALEEMRQAAKVRNVEGVRQAVAVYRESLNSAKARLDVLKRDYAAPNRKERIAELEREIQETDRILKELAKQIPEVDAAVKSLDVGGGGVSSDLLSRADAILGDI